MGKKKKQVGSEKPSDEENPKTQNLQSAAKSNLKIKFKFKRRILDGGPVEEAQALVLPSSIAEFPNANGGETCEVHEENGMKERVSLKKDEARAGKEKKAKKRVKKEEVKSYKRKKESKKEGGEAESDVKTESALYRFPMYRVDRIVRSELSDPRIAPEAVFLINRASEKFLELFCKEAYACASLDRKNSVSYNHLSSVVSKRKRFDFLSDFVPEKIKAEDALKQICGVDK